MRAISHHYFGVHYFLYIAFILLFLFSLRISCVSYFRSLYLALCAFPSIVPKRDRQLRGWYPLYFRNHFDFPPDCLKLYNHYFLISVWYWLNLLLPNVFQNFLTEFDKYFLEVDYNMGQQGWQIPFMIYMNSLKTW